MESQFNKFMQYVKSLLKEEHIKRPKCKGPGLPELSSKKGYRFSRCVENPYSDGYKRIYYGKVGQKVNVKRCLKKMPQPGTGKCEDCKLAIASLKRRLMRKKQK